MVIVVEGSMLEQMDENILKSFTPKDTVILLSGKETNFSVSTVKKLSEIKSKLDIREIPGKEDKEENKLITAYYIGKIMATEKIDKIYSDSLMPILQDEDIAGELGLISIKAKKKAPVKAEKAVPKAKGKRGRKPKTAVSEAPKAVKSKADKPVKAVKTAKADKPKAVKTKASKKAEKAVKSEDKPKKTDIMELIESKASDNIKELAKNNKDSIIKAVKEATDANIGLKTKLELYIREEGWEDIWKILSPEFDKLR